MKHLVCRFPVLLAGILALALSACGGAGGLGLGDGGGGDDDVLPRELAIVSANPAPGAIDVDPATLVEIVFDADLNEASLPEEALVLRIGAGTVTGQFDYDAARRALVFTPLNPLAYATDYDVEVAAGIENVDGGQLELPFAFSFRTADPVQEFEQPHEFEANPARALGLITNDDGIGLSAYVVEKALSYELVIRPYDKAVGFGAPVTLYDGPTEVSLSFGSPIAVNANGMAIIGYKIHGENNDAAVTRLLDARTGNLVSFRSLSTGGADARHPQVAIDDDGNAVAVWTQQAGAGDIQLYGASYDALSGWTASSRIEFAGGDVVDVEVDMGRNGHFLAAWKLSIGNDRAARARPWLEARFGAVRTVHSVLNTRAEIVDAQVLSNGESIVVYTTANSPNPTQFSLKAMRYRPATLSSPGWQDAEFIDDVGGGHMRAVAAQVNGRQLLVAWGVDSPDGVTRLRYRRYIPGPIGWDGAIPLTNLPFSTFQSRILRVTTRDSRHTLFHWSYDNGGANPERRATLVVDGIPATRDLLLPGRGDFGPATGMDARGNTVLVDYIDATLTGFNLVTVDAFGNIAGPLRIDSATGGFIPYRYLAVDADGGSVLLFTRTDNADTSVYHLIRQR